ncbi:hypothetical protein EYF80_051364 [Liparis tanakae]|uniref:Uncharacterized protein n=1 Tax=Liparis tanakae TaxID=230148 RepID=A0A4Z2FDK3_9TELE|nr:hypothetical protein EYF80_051364 [Liparis tanakae]
MAVNSWREISANVGVQVDSKRCTKCSVIPPIEHLIPRDNTHHCDAHRQQNGFDPEPHVSDTLRLPCREGKLTDAVQRRTTHGREAGRDSRYHAPP